MAKQTEKIEVENTENAQSGQLKQNAAETEDLHTAIANGKKSEAEIVQTVITEVNPNETISANVEVCDLTGDADCKDSGYGCCCNNDASCTGNKKLAKKTKIFLIISIILIAVIIISAVTIKFVGFNNFKYEVDSDSINPNNKLMFNDDFIGTDINCNTCLG